MEQAIAASYLNILEKCLKRWGIDCFLERLNIDSARIHDPTAYFNLSEFSYILKQAYIQSQCPYLGLLFGENLSIVNHGFLGYAAMTSPTLEQAIDIMLSFLNTRTNLLRAHMYKRSPDKTVIEFELMTQDELINRFITEMAIVHLAKMRLFLINAIAPCVQIDVTYAAPDYVEYYEQELQTQVNFNALTTCVWFLTSELELPVNFADDTSYQQAKMQLATFAHHSHTVLYHELPQRIKRILYQKPLDQLSMQRVAQELCLSPRTMRRHLQQHFATTYQEILDEVRQQKAIDLLIKSALPITEISFLLGFHNVSNFSKVFKQWTGYTPSDYRYKHNISKSKTNR